MIDMKIRWIDWFTFTQYLSTHLYVSNVLRNRGQNLVFSLYKNQIPIIYLPIYYNFTRTGARNLKFGSKVTFKT